VVTNANVMPLIRKFPNYIAQHQADAENILNALKKYQNGGGNRPEKGGVFYRYEVPAFVINELRDYAKGIEEDTKPR